MQEEIGDGNRCDGYKAYIDCQYKWEKHGIWLNSPINLHLRVLPSCVDEPECVYIIIIIIKYMYSWWSV